MYRRVTLPHWQKVKEKLAKCGRNGPRFICDFSATLARPVVVVSGAIGSVDIRVGYAGERRVRFSAGASGPSAFLAQASVLFDPDARCAMRSDRQVSLSQMIEIAQNSGVSSVSRTA